jgi:hypothetical protein
MPKPITFSRICGARSTRRAARRRAATGFAAAAPKRRRCRVRRLLYSVGEVALDGADGGLSRYLMDRLQARPIRWRDFGDYSLANAAQSHNRRLGMPAAIH